MKKRIKWFNKYFKKGVGEASPKYQQFVDEVQELAFKRAFELLQVSELEVSEQNPIVLLEPAQLDIRSKVRFKVVEHDKDDMELIYDQALLTVLFFGSRSLFYYQGNMDYRYGLVTNDVVGEIRYTDILNVQTSFEYDDIQNPLLEMLTVDLWLIDGSTIPFRLRHRLFNGVMEDLVLSDHEKVVLSKFHETVRPRR